MHCCIIGLHEDFQAPVGVQHCLSAPECSPMLPPLGARPRKVRIFTASEPFESLRGWTRKSRIG